MLSGGIDSSAIAGAAQAMSAAAAEPVHAFTLAFPGRPCDETVYSRAVIEKWGLKATFVDASPLSRGDLLAPSRRYADVPPHPNSTVGDRSAPPPHPRASRAADRFRRRRLFHRRPSADGAPARGQGDRVGSRDRQSAPVRPRARSAPTGPRRASGPATVDSAGVRGADRSRGSTSPAGRLAISDAGTAEHLPWRHEPRPDPRRRDGRARRSGRRRRSAFSRSTTVVSPSSAWQFPSSQRSDGDAIKVVLRRALGDYLPPLVAARISLADKAEFSSTYVEALGGAWWPAGVRSPSVRGRRVGRRSRRPSDVRGHDSPLQPRRRRVHCLHRPAVGGGVAGALALTPWAPSHRGAALDRPA